MPVYLLAVLDQHVDESSFVLPIETASVEQWDNEFDRPDSNTPKA